MWACRIASRELDLSSCESRGSLPGGEVGASEVVDGDGHRRLTAVIDCEGYRSGDRVFDLVTLAFCLRAASCPTTAQDRLWERIRSARDGAVVDAYVAHQALRQVDWSIRHRTSGELEDWMARSRELL